MPKEEKMFDDIKDNMIFTDNETGDKVIFHRKTWLYIIFGILTHYLRYTDSHAERIINESFLYSEKELNFHSVGMLCHDEEYHWAMLLVHGDNYWNHGFNIELPDDYDDWLDSYIRNNNLESSICD